MDVHIQYEGQKATCGMILPNSFINGERVIDPVMNTIINEYKYQ